MDKEHLRQALEELLTPKPKPKPRDRWSEFLVIAVGVAVGLMMFWGIKR